MPQLRAVIVKDRTSGVLHTRIGEFRSNGSLRRMSVDERCQADQSGEFDRLSVVEARQELAGLTEAEAIERVCDYCRPVIDDLIAELVDEPTEPAP